MRYEKIFRRQDGSRINIIANLIINNFDTEPIWKTYIFVCEKGKRTWKSPIDCDSYVYRSKSMQEKEKFYNLEMMKFVSSEELFEVQHELWKKLEPKISNI